MGEDRGRGDWDKRVELRHKDRKVEQEPWMHLLPELVSLSSKAEVRTPSLRSGGHFNMCQVTVSMVTTAPLLFSPNRK